MKALAAFLMLIFLLASSAAFALTDESCYSEFIKEIRAQVVQMGFGKIDDHMQEGYFLVLEDNPYVDINSRIGLSNLYDVCKQENVERWPAIIKGFFGQLKNKRQEQTTIRPLLEEYQTALPFLKVSLYPAEQLQYFQKSSIIDDKSFGFFGVVVVDYPGGAGGLDVGYATKWHMSRNDVVSQALKNTISQNNEVFQEYDFNSGLKVSLLTSDTNPYVATSIYDLSRKRMPTSTYGTLIGVPNRTTIVAVALPSKELINGTVVDFMGLINYLYQQGPERISDKVYWMYGKDLSPIRNDRSSGQIRLPEKLTGMLK